MLKRMAHLSEQTRLIVLAAMTVAILVLVNSQIVVKERIIENGDTLLLRLAPRDPRSLLQGDYMALRYAISNEVAQAAKSAQITDGQTIVDLAQSGEARFVGLYEGQLLTQTQRILRFRKRGDSLRLASDAYFFEEGQGETYARARFGELRVGEDGNALLTGLRDEDRNRLGPTLH